MKKSYNIFLDGERELSEIELIALPPYEWDIIRSYDDFISCVKKNGIPQFISFGYELSSRENGYYCVNWLIDYCFATKSEFPNYAIHSAHEAGKESIENRIKIYKDFLEANKDKK